MPGLMKSISQEIADGLAMAERKKRHEEHLRERFQQILSKRKSRWRNAFTKSSDFAKNHYQLIGIIVAVLGITATVLVKVIGGTS